MVIERVDAYLVEHRGRFEEQLKALLRIPSVSAQPDHDADTRRAAEFVRDDLRAMGVDAELVEFKAGHPIVFGQKLDAPGKPTLLIYGHYDVQPPEPLEPWLTPPFESRQICVPGLSGSSILSRHASPVHGALQVPPPHASGCGGCTPAGSPGFWLHGTGPLSGVAAPVVSGTKSIFSDAAGGDDGGQSADRSYRSMLPWEMNTGSWDAWTVQALPEFWPLLHRPFLHCGQTDVTSVR